MENQYPSYVYTAIHWAVSALALLLTSKIVPGFNVANFGSALIAAVVIGIANVIIWPLLILFTLPINILTLGLFTFVINGAVLKICAALLDGFEINSWMAAIFGAVVLSIVGGVMHFFFV